MKELSIAVETGKLIGLVNQPRLPHPRSGATQVQRRIMTYGKSPTDVATSLPLEKGFAFTIYAGRERNAS